MSVSFNLQEHGVTVADFVIYNAGAFPANSLTAGMDSKAAAKMRQHNARLAGQH